MNIDASINKLLFDHDCVIVPGLGGFVASPRPAAHNKIHHTFIPPARIIAFNVFLKQNDGLLANSISGEEKIPFSEALNFLEKYVERCFMEMSAGRKFAIAEVGDLYYDDEKNIQFEPEEGAFHSLDAFGLNTIRAIRIDKKEQQENALLSPLRHSVAPKEKRKTQLQFSGRKMMNAFLVTGIALWASFNLYIITPGNFNLSNLNPFSKPESSTYIPRSENTLTPKSFPVISPEVPSVSYKTAVPASEIPANVTKEDEKITEAVLPPATPKTEAIKEQGNYFVVAGVFSVPSNAENFLAKLQAEGYASCGSIEREDKPTMVFVSRHQQKEDAVRSVNQLKEKGMDSWMLFRR